MLALQGLNAFEVFNCICNTDDYNKWNNNVAETRIAGDNNQVSEVTRQSDEKTLYKLKIDEMTLRRRNITAQPTAYMQKLMNEYKDTATANKAAKKKTIMCHVS